MTREKIVYKNLTDQAFTFANTRSITYNKKKSVFLSGFTSSDVEKTIVIIAFPIRTTNGPVSLVLTVVLTNLGDSLRVKIVK